MHEQQKMKRGERRGATTTLNREKEITWKITECFKQGWRQKENKQKKEK